MRMPVSVVPGGGQSASARKPVLRALAERPSD